MRVRHGACPLCRGDLHPLGKLGNLAHYRCRNCGIQTSRPCKTQSRRKKPAKTS